MTLLGPELRAGTKAPPFTVLRHDLSLLRLEDSRGKVGLISAVPPVDTRVCDAQAERFTEVSSCPDCDATLSVVRAAVASRG